MSELRQNMVHKEWVIIASERAARPHDFVDHQHTYTHQREEYSDKCPFCPGHEDQTMGEVLRWPYEGPWQLRVFPNKFSALQREGARVQCFEGLQRKLSGVGFHEVLVESPRHNTTLALEPVQTLVLMLKAFQMRGRQLMADPRIEQIFYFKNHGYSAGGSLEHSHCQILALPMVPTDLRQRIEEVRHSYDDLGVCPMCRMLEMEMQEEERIVAQNEHFVAIVPYAAFSPFHLWIVPRRHGPTFLDQYNGELVALADLMRTVLGKIYHGLKDPDYNFNIRSAPSRDSSSAYLHWYISIVPRVTRLAGFELGSGMYINPALPEESARFLREQDPGEMNTSPYTLEEVEHEPFYEADEPLSQHAARVTASR